MAVGYRMPALVLVLLAAANSAEEPQLQGDEARGKRLVAEVCAPCHGSAGVNDNPAIPNLAGQFPEYLAKQLHAFRHDEGIKPKRPNETMTPIAEALNADDIAGLALYLSSLPPASAEASDENKVALGRAIYLNGNAEEGLPACVTCHRSHGEGIRPDFPRLAGQKADYIAKQLTNWMPVRGKPGKLMSLIVPLMKPAEKQAVADFIATLR